jgi:hypothetical protein
MGWSIRRACSVLEFDRSTYHYKSRRREQADVEARIKEICQTRVRVSRSRADASEFVARSRSSSSFHRPTFGRGCTWRS